MISFPEPNKFSKGTVLPYIFRPVLCVIGSLTSLDFTYFVVQFIYCRSNAGFRSAYLACEITSLVDEFPFFNGNSWKNKSDICIKAYWYCVSACPVVKLAFPYFRLVQNITNSASIDTIRIPLNNPMATMIIGVIPLLITEVHLIRTNLLHKGNYGATSLPQTVVPNSLSESCRNDFPEIADM